MNVKVKESRWGNLKLFQRTKSIEKKILRKDKYWHNQLRKVFSIRQSLLKKLLSETREILTQPIETSFLIDPLNTNNAKIPSLVNFKGDFHWN